MFVSQYVSNNFFFMSPLSIQGNSANKIKISVKLNIRAACAVLVNNSFLPSSMRTPKII